MGSLTCAPRKKPDSFPNSLIRIMDNLIWAPRRGIYMDISHFPSSLTWAPRKRPPEVHPASFLRSMDSLTSSYICCFHLCSLGPSLNLSSDSDKDDLQLCTLYRRSRALCTDPASSLESLSSSSTVESFTWAYCTFPWRLTSLSWPQSQCQLTQQASSANCSSPGAPLVPRSKSYKFVTCIYDLCIS
jgi:hypothetical protein